MGQIHQHLYPQQQQQQQERQQKLMSEALSSPIFNHNSQYSYHQIFQQLQNQPTSHELFQYQHHFQAYLQPQQYQEPQQRIRLQQERSITGIPINFKPDLNENGRKDGVLCDEEDAILRESEGYVPETRSTELAMSHSWQNQEDSAIRQPFWKSFCTDNFDRRNNNRGNEEKDNEEHREMNQSNEDYGNDGETEQNSSLEAGKSRLFGELEAICGHAAAAIGNKCNQTGSGSSLNGESLSHHFNTETMGLRGGAAAARFGHDHKGSDEASAGDEDQEPSSRLVHNQKSKKRKKMKDEMGSMAHFFECLVKQLMNHQEVLYKKFVEMIERIDKERKEREEIWRRQELEKLQLEVAAKAHHRALASTRQASIVAHLEKLTGQSITFPSREFPLDSQPEISVGDANQLSTSNRSRNFDNFVMSKRWPKAEVEALIQIRSRLEAKFQEPGLKGLLWEEISNSMSLMGFQRNAKRCKEKWENINKYFKKSKENPKDRRQKLKTCEYFDQLDLLYSKSINKTHGCCYGSSSCSADHHQLLHYGKKLELSCNQQETPNITQGQIKNSYMDFEGSRYEKFEELQQEIQKKTTDHNHEAIGDMGQVEIGREGEKDDEVELDEELD